MNTLIGGPFDGRSWDGPPNPVLYIECADSDTCTVIDGEMTRVAVYIRTETGDYAPSPPPPRLSTPNTFPPEWATDE